MRKAILFALAVVTAAAGMPGRASTESVFEGTFHIVLGDPVGAAGPGRTEYHLALDGGDVRTVHAASDAFADAPQDLDGARVLVRGSEQTDGDIDASRIEAVPGVESISAALTGSQAFATILCRFADVATEPHAPSWYTGLLGSTKPGADHYWRAQSYNAINLTGSAVFGWYQLPQPRSYYLRPDGEMELPVGARDCAAAADNDVYFPSMVGLNFMFNDGIGCCAWGGGLTMALDGETRGYRATWIPPNAQDPSVVNHELGHAFGFPHSSGPYGQTYDSQWDVMSAAYGPIVIPPYGNTPMGTISYHKDLDGWIDPARRYEPAFGTSATLRLQPLGDPAPAPGFLIAKIAAAATAGDFFTVETRRKRGGYDDNVPGEAVIIHRVRPSRSNDAQVVDADGNGNPNDAGAMWLPGETYRDRAEGVRVDVLASAADGGFDVSVAWQTPDVGIDQTDETTIVTEGGPGDSLQVALLDQPAAAVTVNFGDPSGQIVASGVTFTPSDWSTPKTVTVTAVNDSQEEESEQIVALRATITTTDPFYAALAVSDVVVTVRDDDDNTPPESRFTSFDPTIIVVQGSVSGFSTDSTSGVATVELEFASSVNGQTWAVSIDPGCLEPGQCDWTFQIPAEIVPGVYTVVARGSDRAGNRETDGDGITLIVI